MIFSMPYLEGVALESIRMFMGGCFGVPHRALRDTTLNGYFIPKVKNVVSNHIIKCVKISKKLN